MRLYSRDSIAGHAFIVQERAFYAAIPFALAFIVFALIGHRELAMAAALLDTAALGISAGAWFVARRFKD